MRTRVTFGPAVVVTAVAALAGPAAAHITVNPSTATQGGFAKLAFRVPNERDSAGTTQVEINFPTDRPIGSVSVKPHPGWTHTVTTVPIDPPVASDHGPITEAVSKILWTGGRIGPGEFDEFEISTRLPGEGEQIEFKALQTYENGEVVRWIEPTVEGQPEPEHPAPVVKLTVGDSESPDSHGAATGRAGSSGSGTEPADDDLAGSATIEAASESDVSTVRTVAVLGLVAGLLGLAVGAVALLIRRRPTS